MTTPIPRPQGVPILGNIFDINPSNTWASLAKLAETYGEIFQVKVLGSTIVFIAGAALAEEICDRKRFRKYVGGPIVGIRYAVHDALFTAYEDEQSWGVAHRIIAPRLSSDAVKGWFLEMRDITAELIEKWKGVGGDDRVSLIDELNRLNLEVTTFTLYGMKLNSLSGPEHPMIRGMEDATSEAMKRPTRPGLLNWLVYGGKFKQASAAMRKYAAEVVDYRKTHPTDRQDVLAAMLAATDPETGKSLTESQVIDEIVSMPIGSSTAPCLVTSAIYFMLKNPHVMSRARTELDAVIGDGEFTYEHLSQLPYLQGIVRESLRLGQPAPGFNIEPIPSKDKSPVLLGNGKYQVAHDQAMIIVLAGVNRDPTVFADPLTFRPERMTGEAFGKLPAGAKKWYGNGKRECIGKHWATQFNMTVLATLIRDIDFAEVDPGYTMTQDGWFNVRPVNFFVRVRPRVR
jgi:cytochrome P450